MSNQSREFYKFFWAIIIAAAIKHFREIFAFRYNIFIFRSFARKKFAKFRFIYYREKMWNFAKTVCKMRPKILAFFCEKFLLLETLTFLFWPKPDMFTVWNFLPLYVYFALEIVLHCTCFLTMDKVEIFTTVHVHCTNAGGK